MEEHAKLPLKERLRPDCFYIDPGLEEQMKQEATSRLDAAQQELAWLSANNSLARKKLECSFLQDLNVESIVLYGFANSLAVCNPARTADPPSSAKT
jgi:hypothetical protein